MNRRRAGDKGSTKSRDMSIRRVQSLACELQRIANTGCADSLTLDQVDRHVNSQLLGIAVHILDVMDYLMDGIANACLQEELYRIYLNTVDLLTELERSVDFGYRRLLKRNGHVSPQKLNSLIDLDSELVSSLLKFDNTFKIVDATTLTSRKCSDFRQLIDDSRSILSSRRRLLR